LTPANRRRAENDALRSLQYERSEAPPAPSDVRPGTAKAHAPAANPTAMHTTATRPLTGPMMATATLARASSQDSGVVRVILTHDFFETFGGAERVTAEIAAAFPDASVHAILGRRSVAARMGIDERVETILPEHPQLLERYRALAPLYPGLVRMARLPEADVVIASSYAYAHGFRTPNRAPVLCYCHGPFRHLWSQQEAYAAQLPGGPAARAMFEFYVRAARAADQAAARAVSHFMTQSPFTAQLIARAYRRDAQLLPPPVNCELFRPSVTPPRGYFLFVGRLVEPYKRPSIVIEAFSRMPEHQLVVAGDGPALDGLRRRATPNVSFVGQLEDGALVEAMQGCEAALFPSTDDFGLVPLEVNACGRPVIAVRAGGPQHTVKPGVTGEFLAAQSSAAIEHAVRAHVAGKYDPQAIRRHALQFGHAEFRRRIRAAAERLAVNAAAGVAGRQTDRQLEPAPFAS
jgi:glycosyltransferase involved in cell wall biosynthesis